MSSDDDDAREALWVPTDEFPSKPLISPHWWREAHFVQWLLGGSKMGVPAQPLEGEIRMERRIQAHVGIKPDTLAADDGILFSHDLVETLERGAEWAVGVEVEFPSQHGPTMASVGSDGRLARIEELPSDLFEPPKPLLAAFRDGVPGLRLVVTTPACFSGGWLPDGFASVGREYRGCLPNISSPLILRAALVPRPIHVSGWDMAARQGRGAPKATSRMVTPGTVYFFERTDKEPFGEEVVDALWLANLGSRNSEGFGRAVPGAWFPR